MEKIIKKIKKIYFSIKHLIESFIFLKTLFSPFKPIKLKFYFGEIKIAHPYFLPRRLNRLNEYVPIKYFGFDYNSLGWKRKFSDIRFEWSPSYSIILFGYQFNITIVPNINTDIDHYWEAWIVYNYETDKNLSQKERLIKTFQKYSCTWSSYSNNDVVSTDNYLYILKKDWIDFYKQWKLEQDPIYRRNKKIDNITLNE
jgi:hypothetical protein